jgi:hypothetical protein
LNDFDRRGGDCAGQSSGRCYTDATMWLFSFGGRGRVLVISRRGHRRHRHLSVYTGQRMTLSGGLPAVQIWQITDCTQLTFLRAIVEQCCRDLIALVVSDRGLVADYLRVSIDAYPQVFGRLSKSAPYPQAFASQCFRYPQAFGRLSRRTISSSRKEKRGVVILAPLRTADWDGAYARRHSTTV